MFVRCSLSDEQKQRCVRVPATVMYCTVMSFFEAKYSKINSMKSHDSDAGNVSERRLMSQSGSARVDQDVSAVSAVRAVEVPVFVCERNSCKHVNEEDRKVCGTRAESCHAK